MHPRSERITAGIHTRRGLINKLKIKTATSPNFLLARLHGLSYNEVRLTD